MARILIVGGGCRGLALARRLHDAACAVRITTRDAGARELIEAAGAECLFADPNRLASMRNALDGVTLACWLLASANGELAELEALHGARLRSFMHTAIDTTVRGVVYEAGAASGSSLARQGAQIAREVSAANAIPLATIEAAPDAVEAWMEAAWRAVQGLL
jgi:nucleoside-diphosphate-sugar epimerase